jgi:hypothetical protein
MGPGSQPSAVAVAVFLGAETAHGFMPYGTAFLGLAIYEDMANVVAITAGHVVDAIPGDEVLIRVNRHDGTAKTVGVKKKHKIAFNDDPIDLAVLPCSLDPTIYDIYAFPPRNQKLDGACREFWWLRPWR